MTDADTLWQNSEKRRYDEWAGNPNGTKENTTNCIEEVNSWSGWHNVQCSRKRGFGPKGLYCKQHAKMVEKRAVVNAMRREVGLP